MTRSTNGSTVRLTSTIKRQLCDGEMTIEGIKEQHMRVTLENIPEAGEMETIIIDSFLEDSTTRTRTSEVNTSFKAARGESST